MTDHTFIHSDAAGAARGTVFRIGDLPDLVLPIPGAVLDAVSANAAGQAHVTRPVMRTDGLSLRGAALVGGMSGAGKGFARYIADRPAGIASDADIPTA